MNTLSSYDFVREVAVVDKKAISKKEATRQRILEAMHKSFRQQGYDGAGVDGLAREAGVTSGAFYSHFGSKANAFREVVVEGVQQFGDGVEQFQKEYGEEWLDQFAKFYLGEKRQCDLSESCALQSLSAEVTRSDEKTREIFQMELMKVAETFSKGLQNSLGNGSEKSSGDKKDDEVWATMAMLIGGVTLARAVKDPELANSIAASIQNVVNKDCE